jgi:hypothetical protein
LIWNTAAVFPAKSVELTLAGIEVRKNACLQLRGKTKFETLQTVEETLFANRKTMLEAITQISL